MEADVINKCAEVAATVLVSFRGAYPCKERASVFAILVHYDYTWRQWRVTRSKALDSYFMLFSWEETIPVTIEEKLRRVTVWLVDVHRSFDAEL